MFLSYHWHNKGTNKVNTLSKTFSKKSNMSVKSRLKITPRPPQRICCTKPLHTSKFYLVHNYKQSEAEKMDTKWKE